MPRRRRRFTRKSGNRDATLIVIATEDTEATVRYFEDFRDHYWDSRVHVEVLRRQHTASSPRHVLQQLNEFRRNYDLERSDELWMVIDVDRWGQALLSDVAARCEQKGFLLAVSNPCIEIWFLLHVADVDTYSQQALAELEKNQRVSAKRTRIEVELVNVLGSYNKSNLNTKQLLPHVEFATEQAQGLDIDPQARWPDKLGTRVYRLAQSILRHQNPGTD